MPKAGMQVVTWAATRAGTQEAAWAATRAGTQEAAWAVGADTLEAAWAAGADTPVAAWATIACNLVTLGVQLALLHPFPSLDCTSPYSSPCLDYTFPSCLSISDLIFYLNTVH